MAKITKLELDANLKEWIKEAKAGKHIQKGLRRGLIASNSKEYRQS